MISLGFNQIETSREVLIPAHLPATGSPARNRAGRLRVCSPSSPSSKGNDHMVFRTIVQTPVGLSSRSRSRSALLRRSHSMARRTSDSLQAGQFPGVRNSGPARSRGRSPGIRSWTKGGWRRFSRPNDDGLSRAVSRLGDSLQAPAAVFVRGGEHYRGRLRVHDAFATRTWIHLNARAQYLARVGTHLNVLEMSPQGFGHEVWRQLASIRVRGPGGINAAAGR